VEPIKLRLKVID